MARVKKEFVTDKLNELYLTKWKAQGKTQREFAEAIRNVDPFSGINETYVSKLLNGVYSPKSYLPAICEVLDVDISEFTPKTHDDRYQYATAFADGLEDTLEGFAKEHFGIDLTFFQGLRNIIPEFDSMFPVYAPLFFYDVNSYDTNGRERNVFERRVPVEAMETSSGRGLFQITKDGKTYFLTKYDMKFIRGLQLRIRKLVTQYFITHQRQLDMAEAKANEYFWEKNMEENPDYEKDKTLWTTYVLCDKELQDIDKDGIYTQKERDRFNLPPDGTPLFTEDLKKTEG